MEKTIVNGSVEPEQVMQGMLGNCTICRHSHLTKQLDQVQLVCRKGPPALVAISTGHGRAQMISAWPPVNEQMVCDAFEMSAQRKTA